MRKTGSERRGSGRVPMQSEAVLTVKAGRLRTETYTAHVRNMSSSGLLFESDAQVELGKRVELSMLWPVKLDNKCDLKLNVIGRIVRRDGNRTAMTVDKKEFRTAGQSFSQSKSA